MAKPQFLGDEKEPSSSLMTRTGKVKSAGLLAKKPALSKFGSKKSNGLPRAGKM